MTGELRNLQGFQEDYEKAYHDRDRFNIFALHAKRDALLKLKRKEGKT